MLFVALNPNQILSLANDYIVGLAALSQPTTWMFFHSSSWAPMDVLQSLEVRFSSGLRPRAGYGGENIEEVLFDGGGDVVPPFVPPFRFKAPPEDVVELVPEVAVGASASPFSK